jgi:hypothetical protein
MNNALLSTTQNQAVISNGLLGYWSFNDGSGTIARDFSANNYSGSLINSPPWVLGVLGTALHFNGSSQYVSVSQNGHFKLSTSPFSISVWVWDDTAYASLGTYHRIVSWYDGSNNIQLGLGQGASTPTRMFYLSLGNGSPTPQIVSGGDISVGSFHHVVVTFNGSSTYTMYKDGISTSGGTSGGGGTTMFNGNSTTLYIGQRGDGAYTSGYIDEVRIYNRVLNQSEVTALYAEGLQGGTVIHPTVINWASQVSYNGGAAVSFNTLQALSTFMYGMDAAGLTSKMQSVNCFVPDSLIAATTPLISVIGTNRWTPTNFVGVGTDLNSNGLAGNGSNKYLNMNFNANSTTLNNVGITVYLYTSSSYNGNDKLICGTQNSTNNLAFYPDSNTLTASVVTPTFDCYSYTGGGRNSTYITTIGNGYWSANRTSTSSSNIYRARSNITHSLVNSTSTIAGSPPAQAMYFFALNNNGSAYGFSNATASFGAVHLGLSQTDSATFYNLIQTMRTSLGGGYV